MQPAMQPIEPATPTPAAPNLAPPFPPLGATQADLDAYDRALRAHRTRCWSDDNPTPAVAEPPPPVNPQPTDASATLPPDYYRVQAETRAHEKLLLLHQALVDPAAAPAGPAPLTPTLVQERAILLLVQGRSDAAIARELGIHRTTINRWRLFDAVFIARLNRARLAIWANTIDALRAALPRAVEILTETIQSDNHPARARAAIQLLKIAGASKLPTRTGPTTTHDVLFDMALKTQRRNDPPGNIRANTPPGEEDLASELREAARLLQDPSELTPPPDPTSSPLRPTDTI